MHFNKEKFLMLLLLLVVIASGLDLMHDLNEGIGLDHILQEAAVFSGALAAIIWLTLGWRKQTAEIKALQADLTQAQMMAQNSNQELQTQRREFSKVIAQQFQTWELSQSEQEVAWLLLKGLSLKEIAALRSTAEKTVRQQASTLYGKAGLSGRHAFSAWFIEDLL